MTDKTNFCMGCMADMAGNTVCPQCGWNSQEPQMLHALPYGASLQGRYIVGRAQKTNGEGITYIGRDTVQKYTGGNPGILSPKSVQPKRRRRISADCRGK